MVNRENEIQFVPPYVYANQALSRDFRKTKSPRNENSNTRIPLDPHKK